VTLPSHYIKDDIYGGSDASDSLADHDRISDHRTRSLQIGDSGNFTTELVVAVTNLFAAVIWATFVCSDILYAVLEIPVLLITCVIRHKNGGNIS
jgi:hypothetical protein